MGMTYIPVGYEFVRYVGLYTTCKGVYDMMSSGMMGTVSSSVQCRSLHLGLLV